MKQQRRLDAGVFCFILLDVIPGSAEGRDFSCAIAVAQLRTIVRCFSHRLGMTMAAHQHLLLNDWFPAFAIRRIGFMTWLPFIKKRRRTTFKRRII